MPRVVRPPLHRLSRFICRSLTISFLCLGILEPIRQSSAANAERRFDSSLNKTANAFLDRRAIAVDKLQTRADAEARTAQFREFVLAAIGGLPRKRTPLSPRVVGTLDEDGFKVERLIYDSLPGFHIPANLYLPKSGNSPYPAILYTPGHYPVGKLEAWNLASNMARNGIAVLAYDPIGEGERLQYFDPGAKKSLAGQPTGEHSEAGVQIALTGDHISRYFLWDAMRGLDYLASRSDIDANRIGAFGCSGGGAVTAYLAAFDRRLKAAGVACYITSFSALLGTIGPQEAEQSIPGFINHGFDFPDWIEAAAPVPYAVISTSEDMFPFEGARKSVNEARRIYGLYGAEKNLEWITGPGRHANLRPIHSEIIGFFLRQLRQSDEAPTLTQLDAPPANQLECTSSGQVSTSFPGETLFSLNRTAAHGQVPLRRSIRSTADIASFRDHVIHEVRALTGTEAKPGKSSLQVTFGDSSQRNGYILKNLRFLSVTGEDLAGMIALPSLPGKHPAALLLANSASGDIAREGGELDLLAKTGNLVFAPELPPATPDREAPKSELLGPFSVASLRAQIVGKTLVGLRIDDAIHCVDWLSSRPEVNPAKISGWGSGAMGIVLLHAAALDPRIREITLDNTLISYRSAVESPVTHDLAQSVIPGVLRQYDLDDLMIAASPRSVSLISSIDGGGHPVDAEIGRKELSRVFEADRALHCPGRVKLVPGGAGGPSHPDNARSSAN